MAYGESELVERAALLDEVTFTAPQLVIALATEIDLHQRNTSDILAHPLPTTVPKEIAANLKRNTSEYDPEIEAAISKDEIINKIHKADDPHEQRGVAIRARRSAIVLVLLAYNQAELPGAVAA